MKRHAISLITFVAAVVAIGLLAPKRLASQYASPVNAMNSKSAPALIRDTDNPRRTPYVSSVQAGPDCPPPGYVCSFTPAPNNMRLVITHIDAWGFTSSLSAPLQLISLYQVIENSRTGPTPCQNCGQAFPEFTNLPPMPNTIPVNYISSRALEYYVEPGSAPQVQFSGSGPLQPMSATLTGYLIDCTNGCAPIVH